MVLNANGIANNIINSKGKNIERNTNAAATHMLRQ